MITTGTQQVWFLTGSQHLYGTEVLMQASTDQNFKAEIYSYSRSKGLFAGVSLDGTGITIDRKANETVYGDMASPASIFDGRTQTQNQAVIDFRNQLEEGSSRQAKK